MPLIKKSNKIILLRTVLVVLNAADGTELQYSGDGNQGKEG